MMKRLTTDHPDGNFEMAMNFVYSKDGVAYIRSDGDRDDVPLHEWAKAQCLTNGCGEFPGETMEEIDEEICSCGIDFQGCPVHLAYTFACQAVQLRGRLKMYEDTGLTPEKITDLQRAWDMYGGEVGIDGILAENRELKEKRTPKCYSPDTDGGCRYLVPDGDDEPIARCKRCPLCCVDKQRKPQDPNPPLTLDELREMDGEPVWIEYIPSLGEETAGFWGLVYADKEDGEVSLLNGFGGSSRYDEVWVDIRAIYRRKPEETTKRWELM